MYCQTETTKKYSDIINLPHYVSKTRPQMEISDRAAQFSPFAALTGYDAAVKECGRLTEEFFELDESRKDVLDKKLQLLLQRKQQQKAITIIYFLPDEKKQGGAYVEIVEKIKRIDEYERCLIMFNDKKIPFDMIYDIQL